MPTGFYWYLFLGTIYSFIKATYTDVLLCIQVHFCARKSLSHNSYAIQSSDTNCTMWKTGDIPVCLWTLPWETIYFHFHSRETFKAERQAVEVSCVLQVLYMYSLLLCIHVNLWSTSAKKSGTRERPSSHKGLLIWINYGRMNISFKQWWEFGMQKWIDSLSFHQVNGSETYWGDSAFLSLSERQRLLNIVLTSFYPSLF